MGNMTKMKTKQKNIAAVLMRHVEGMDKGYDSSSPQSKISYNDSCPFSAVLGSLLWQEHKL